MIVVDDQGPKSASGKYAEKLQERGLNAVLGRLRYGDISFYGTGPGGDTVSIGIEIKGVREFCSDTQSPRFKGFQLPGMVAAYDYRYLIVRGLFRPAYRTGLLEVPYGKRWSPVRLGDHNYTYSEFMAQLNTVREQAGFSFFQTSSDHELVALVHSLHTWWYKGFDSHGSLRVFYEPKKALGIRAPSKFRRAVHALCPGVGWKKTEALEETYGTIEELLDAEPTELEAIEGIGPKLAKQLYRALRTS